MLLSSPSRQSIPRGMGLICCPHFLPLALPAAYLHLCWAPHTRCLHTQAAYYFCKELKPAAALHLQTYTLLNPPRLKLIIGWEDTTPMRSEPSKCTPTCLRFLTPLQPPLGLSLQSPASSEAQASSLHQTRKPPPPSPTPPVPAWFRSDLCPKNSPSAYLTFSPPAYECLLTLSGSFLIWLLSGEWPVPSHWFPTASATALLQSVATRLAALEVKRLSIAQICEIWSNLDRAG